MDYEIYNEIVNKMETFFKGIREEYNLGDCYFNIHGHCEELYKALMSEPKAKTGDIVRIIKPLSYGEPVFSIGVVTNIDLKEDGRDRSEIASRRWYRIFIFELPEQTKFHSKPYVTTATEDEFEVLNDLKVITTKQ